MPTYSVNVDGAEYSFEAPDDKSAGAYADDIHSSVKNGTAKPSTPSKEPDVRSVVDEFGGSVGKEFLDRLKGIPAAMKEAFTGEQRQTESTRATPDYRIGTGAGKGDYMPEMEGINIPNAKVAIGTMATGPEETAKIIKSQYPNVEIFNDEKGNFFLKSAINGEMYAIKPGFNAGDILRAAGTAATYMAGGEVVGAMKGGKAALQGVNALRKAPLSLIERAAGAGLSQAGIETVEARTGGTFDAEKIAETAAAELGLGVLGKGVSAAKESLFPAGSRVLSSANPSGKLGALETGGFGVGGGEGASIPASEVAGAAERMAAKDPIKALKSDPDFIAISRGVSKNDPAAIEKLAQYIDADPAGLEAARELGVDLPADIFSANKQLKAAMGLARAQIASPEQSAFLTAQEGASQKLNTAIEQLGAKDISTMSSDVRDSLKATRSELSERASSAYDKTPIPKAIKVDAANVIDYLDGVLGERAGNEAALSGIEKKIYQEAKQRQLTFARLKDFKGELRLMESGRAGEYANLVDARRRGLSNAINADEFATATKVGGQEGESSLREANSLYAQKKALDEKIVQGFGQAENGSISDIIKTAIKKGSAGSEKKLNELLEIVPHDLHTETLLTGILDASKSQKTAGEYVFDPKKFEVIFRGIIEQKEIAKIVGGKIGERNMKKLQEVFAVSKALNDIISTPPTGATLQASDLFRSSGFIGRMAEKATGPTSGAATGAIIGGPIGEFMGVGHQIGATVGSIIGAGAGQIGKKAIEQRGAKFLGVLSSPEFKSLAIKQARNQKPSSAEINRFVFSKPFRKFAKETGLDMSKAGLTAWVTDSLQPKTKQ